MNANPTPSSPFPAISRDPRTVVRLFCIPFAGGGASAYFRWSEGLPPEFQVCPIQLAGHESRFAEPPYRSMPPLIEELGRALIPWTDIPFAIFGHSMGSLIGFELARYLRRVTGKGPICFFASSRRAPQVTRAVRKVAELPDREFIQEMQEQYNAIPELILRDRELMERFIPILKADMSVLESYEYRHEEPFGFGVSVFGGIEDEHVSKDELEAWRHQTTGMFRIRQFPGGHFFFRDTRVKLLESIGQDLIETLSRGGLREH